MSLEAGKIYGTAYKLKEMLNRQELWLQLTENSVGRISCLLDWEVANPIEHNRKIQ